MVFDSEAVFQQFLHCKFRENVVRLLVLPGHNPIQLHKGHRGQLLLIVTKWGSVGLYNPFSMGLLQTFCLDMEVNEGDDAPRHRQRLGISTPRPKCRQSHLVVDAVSAEDIRCVIFATTKGILQCYDTGELEEEDLGLDILPRGQFFELTRGQSPLPPKNLGFVETHRIHGLGSVPSCLHYHQSSGNYASKLLVGHVDGVVTILEVGVNGDKVNVNDAKVNHDTTASKYPFGGRRKVRGSLAQLRTTDLGVGPGQRVKSYRGHHDPVKEILWLGGGSGRKLILSASRDPKFSLFCEDFTGISESFIISLPKGVNTVTHSERLSLIVTGSEDGVVRLFSEFSMKMPQMELSGHRGAVVGLALLPLPFDREKEILLSYSEDVELRAWDPVTFVCLQSLYIRFPGGGSSSTIICKTPEFGHEPLILFLNQDEKEDGKQGPWSSSKRDESCILLLYCNGYAKLNLDRGDPTLTRSWPFDFDLDDLIPPSVAKSKTKLKSAGSKNARDPKSLSLDLQEMGEMENRAIITMNSLMRHKYETKNEDPKNRSQTGKDKHRQRSLTALATSTLESLHISGGEGLEFLEMSRVRQRHASIFDKLPYHEIEPIPIPKPPKYYLQNDPELEEEADIHKDIPI